ncbi:hypothetical protein HAP94_02085 [Acidithiobacillus ferrivorans]|nr:hypothetical protein [Acidithiobacillus ferrivorans]
MSSRKPPLAGCNPIDNASTGAPNGVNAAPDSSDPHKSEPDSIAQREARAHAYLAEKACSQATRAAALAGVFLAASTAVLVTALAVSFRNLKPSITPPDRGTADQKGAPQ